MCVLCWIIFSACGEKDENKVVFLNHIPGTDLNDIIIQNNVVCSGYELDADEDTLYAFCVEYERYVGEPLEEFQYKDGESKEERNYRVRTFLTQELVKILEGTDLEIISDYPYCLYTQPEDEEWMLGLCAVAGTMEQIEAIFDGTEPIDGHCFRLWSAPRPDYLDKMRKAGWDGNLNGIALDGWVDSNSEKMEKLVGTENQVTMKVDFEIGKNE